MFYSGLEVKDSAGAEVESRQFKVNKVSLDGTRRKVANWTVELAKARLVDWREHAIACLQA
jgi:hypothetical protein